jgi:hypothetical protein
MKLCNESESYFRCRGDDRRGYPRRDKVLAGEAYMRRGLEMKCRQEALFLLQPKRRQANAVEERDVTQDDLEKHQDQDEELD